MPITPGSSRKGTDMDRVLQLPPPATTLEGRNDQLTNAAFSLVERRLHDGTASAQETVHFLKMGATNYRLQEEKLRMESLALEARIQEAKNRNSGEELMKQALAAFRGYSGQEPIPEEHGGDPDLY
jgi:hypothetical protein